MPNRLFLPQIDALRGVAALAVLLYHVFDPDGPDGPRAGVFSAFSLDRWSNYVLTTVFNGTGAVTLFFVISGFVLSIGLRPSDVLTARHYASFAVRRCFRIFPAAWASLGLATVMSFVYLTPADWTNWVRVLLLDKPAIDMNGPLWSLRVEIIACVAFPFLAFANLRMSPLMRAAVAAGMAVAPRFFPMPWWADYLFCFQLGIMISHAAPLIMERLGDRLALLLLCVATAAILIPANLSRLGLLSTPKQLLIEAAGAFYVVAYVAAREHAPLVRFLKQPAPRFLGRVSYSLYVFNILIIRMVSDLMAQLLGDHYSNDHALQFHAMVGLIAVPLALAVAWVSWRLFEEPFHRIGRRLGRAIMAQPQLPAGVAMVKAQAEA